MTTETNQDQKAAPQPPKLKPPEKLDPSTAEVWRGLFCTFHLECGYQQGPPQAKTDAYWMKLRDFPEKILMDMLDTFLRDKVRHCPPVGEMIEICRNRLVFYERQYVAQQERPEQKEKQDPDMVDYRLAVRKAVFAIMKQRPSMPEKERRELIREAVYRVANEFGFEPLLMWLPKNQNELEGENNK